MAGTRELDPRSDYGYAIYLGIMPPGGATLEQAASDKHYLMKPPADGRGLQHYRFTRRREEKILFRRFSLDVIILTRAGWYGKL
ncbi:MAG: hypothetical protein LBP80_04675 [Treponema sp.]|jgi:hypothetical protein|nr:hypothetical protein [Treponema sp.]